MTGDFSTTMETLENDDELETKQESESVEDSARAVLEELRADGKDDEADESSNGAEVQEEQAAVDPSEAARILAKSKKPKKRQVIDAKDLQTGTNTQATTEPALEPPARFPVEYKEKFHKLPRPVQEQALEFWNGMEGNMTKKLQEASRYVQKYQHIDQLVSHYAPMFHEQGFTETQALAELFATWKNIKEKPAETIRKIANNLGLTPEQIFNQQTSAAPQQHVAANYLTPEELDRKLEEREQRLRQQSALEAAVNEVAQLRNERDPNTGAYLYPELWDEMFLTRVQPLVKYHRETQPGLSIVEATKRAVATHRGQFSAPGSPSSPGTRLTPQEEIQKIKQASVSVRPRGNGAIPTMGQARHGESVKESAEAILAEFRRH